MNRTTCPARSSASRLHRRELALTAATIVVNVPFASQATRVVLGLRSNSFSKPTFADRSARMIGIAQIGEVLWSTAAGLTVSFASTKY